MLCGSPDLYFNMHCYGIFTVESIEPLKIPKELQLCYFLFSSFIPIIKECYIRFVQKHFWRWFYSIIHCLLPKSYLGAGNHNFSLSSVDCRKRNMAMILWDIVGSSLPTLPQKSENYKRIWKIIPRYQNRVNKINIFYARYLQSEKNNF